jgi:hypothetical protein
MIEDGLCTRRVVGIDRVSCQRVVLSSRPPVSSSLYVIVHAFSILPPSIFSSFWSSGGFYAVVVLEI